MGMSIALKACPVKQEATYPKLTVGSDDLVKLLQ